MSSPVICEFAACYSHVAQESKHYLRFEKVAKMTVYRSRLFSVIFPCSIKPYLDRRERHHSASPGSGKGLLWLQFLKPYWRLSKAASGSLDREI